ncbi:MAG: hypothetical protein GY817_05540 [bacterium]|nr:hypothetical protein [bacterium]
MSKYNLIDIYEQYQIGSGWTNDFDYDGMLKTGLGTSIDTPIEVLKKISDDFEDVNYHRENQHLSYAIDAIEIGDMMEAESRLNDFHKEIKATMGDQGMDIEPTLGKFMASKMEENTEAVDLAIEASQEKAGIKEARTYASVDKEVADRIEGMLSIPMKAKFLNAWEDLFYDLVEEDPFYVDDVIAHLSNEMGKVIDGNQMAGDRLAGIGDFEQEEFTAIPEEDTIEEAAKDIIGVAKSVLRDMPHLDIYIDSLQNDIRLNGEESYSGFSAEDFEEDYNNYIADKSLQEHFKRFI